VTGLGSGRNGKRKNAMRMNGCNVPYQNLAKRAGRLVIDKLLCVAELDVHVAVDAL